MDFHVILKTNLTTKQIAGLLRNMEKKVDNNEPLLKQQSDCFVCCILSYRDADIHENNEEPVTRSILKECVRPEHCPGLKEKPKLFFIQTIRVRKKKEVFTDNLIARDKPPGRSVVPLGDIFIAESTLEVEG